MSGKSDSVYRIGSYTSRMIAGLESHEESLTKENVELKSELDALRASAPAETKKSPGKTKEA